MNEIIKSARETDSIFDLKKDSIFYNCIYNISSEPGYFIISKNEYLNEFMTAYMLANYLIITIKILIMKYSNQN